MTETASPEPVFDREAFRKVRLMTEERVRAGARLSAIIARENDDGTIELIYLFDQEGKITNFRFTIMPEWEVDSVVDVFKGALNLEREVVDLFGLRFKGVKPGLMLAAGKGVVAPLRRKKTPAPTGGDVHG